MDAEEDEKDAETEDPFVSADSSSSEALRGSVFLLFGSGLPDLLDILIVFLKA
jgi:hypothetical protein